MTATERSLDAQAILAIFEAVHDQEEAPPGEGLRERKKRRLRQRISNVATALFLAEGFENVSVTRIAAVADVSEQTVFNYFPTKESMFFDRDGSFELVLGDAIRRADRALAQAVAEGLARTRPRDRWDGLDEADALYLMRLFANVAESSPDLRTAFNSSIGGSIPRIARALAERTGTDSESPEVRLAATVITGLAYVQLQAVFSHSRRVSSLAEIGPAVDRDVARALRLAGPLLDAFDRPRPD
jgi:AcrR family transcriptional regulator